MTSGWTLLITICSALQGASASLHRRHRSRQLSQTLLASAPEGMVPERMVSFRHLLASSQNASATGEKPVPTPARLRVCNAMGGSMTAKVGHVDHNERVFRAKLASGPTPYKSCSEMKGNLQAGDAVGITIGDIGTTVHLPGNPHAADTVILLVVVPNKVGHPSVPNAKIPDTIDVMMQYFHRFRYPFVATVEASPEANEEVSVKHYSGRSKHLLYGDTAPVEPGSFDVLLNGAKAQGGELSACCGESYVIMHIAAGEVAVYPPAIALDNSVAYSCDGPDGKPPPPPGCPKLENRDESSDFGGDGSYGGSGSAARSSGRHTSSTALSSLLLFTLIPGMCL